MFELVKTNRQQKRFETTWEYFCLKYNWVNDPYAKHGSRYNLLLQNNPFYRKKKSIGTIEFIPYNPKCENSTVEGVFAFSKYDDIQKHQQQTWEVDKLCIHQDYQRQGYFLTLLRIIYIHGSQNNVHYYLAIMEGRLYRMLRMMFGPLIEQRGERFYGPDSENVLIPTVIHIKKIINDQEIMMRYKDKI